MAEATGEVKIENPFKEGTKKFLVAERLLKEETDSNKIAKEVGVKKDTVYSVKSELRGLGIYQEAREG